MAHSGAPAPLFLWDTATWTEENIAKSRFLKWPFKITRGQLRFDIPHLGKFRWGLICPIEVHVHFVAVGDFTTYGDHSMSGKHWHDVMQHRSRLVSKEMHLFVPMIRKRKDARIAKSKLYNLPRIAKKHPNWRCLADLEDMKHQFISYDLNHDGLIDFPELVKALDELGDTSTYEVRRKCFDEIDIDGSDSVDFVEFLGLVDTMKKMGSVEKDNFLEIFRKGTDQPSLTRRLTRQQLMDLRIY